MVELGRKYECPDCGVKFYDLGKPEALCPKCGRDLKSDEDDHEIKAPPPRSAPARAPATRAKRDDDEDGDSDGGDEVLATDGDDEEDEDLDDLDDLDDDDDDDLDDDD